MIPEDTLRTWVREHRICWELAPLLERNGHTQVQVGYELRLFARHRAGTTAAPGCPECRDLFEKMRAVALFAFPQEDRPSRHQIEPFDASFHLRPESHWVPELQLGVQIIHREGYFRSVDDCERRCAKEIQESLRKLGAQPKVWTERQGA